MKHISVLLALILFISSNAAADEKTKRDKIRKLMEISEAYDGIEEAKKQKREYSTEVRRQLISQLKIEYPCIDDETMSRIDNAYATFYKETEPRWSVEEAIEQYITLLSEYYTEQEIDELLELTQTPIWHKSLKVSKDMAPKWTQWIKNQDKIALEEAMPKFTKEYKEIGSGLSEKECE